MRIKKNVLIILCAISLYYQTQAQVITFSRARSTIIKAEYRDVGAHVNTLNLALLGNYNSIEARPTGQVLANYNSTNGKWEANALVGLLVKYDRAKDLQNSNNKQYLLPQTPK